MDIKKQHVLIGIKPLEVETCESNTIIGIHFIFNGLIYNLWSCNSWIFTSTEFFKDSIGNYIYPMSLICSCLLILNDELKWLIFRILNIK